MFQGSFQWVSRVLSRGSKVFQGCSKKVFKDASRKFQGCFKKVTRFCEGRLRCFNGVLSGFQGCLKEVQWVLEGIFKGLSRMFKGTVSRKILLA